MCVCVCARCADGIGLAVRLGVSRCCCRCIALSQQCLQCFDTVGWASGRAGLTETAGLDIDGRLRRGGHSRTGQWKCSRPVKIRVMRCWRGYLSGARCRLFEYGPADATAIPKPHHLVPHFNPNWFTFLVPAYPDCPGKWAVKRVQ